MAVFEADLKRNKHTSETFAFASSLQDPSWFSNFVSEFHGRRVWLTENTL